MVVKVWQMGVVPYDTALNIQRHLVRQQLSAASQQHADTLLVVQHAPVYTVGVRGDTSLEEANRLRALGAHFRKVERGGMVTFHGPGQLVAYPILNLKHFKTSVKWYVWSLEECVIETCRALGVRGSRSPHTGVWVDDNKLAAIGVRASRYVTSHGISINCNNDLSWFDHIDPCGLGDKGVTSLSVETRRPCTVEEVAPLLVRSFARVFQCPVEPLPPRDQQDILRHALPLAPPVSPPPHAAGEAVGAR